MNRAGLWLSLIVVASGFCEGEREADVKSDKSKVEIVATSKGTDKNSKCSDVMKILLETKDNDGLHVRLDFETKDTTSASKFHLRQKAFQVIEFNDANSNNIIDDGEIIKTIRLGGAGNVWADVKSSVTAEQGVDVNTLTATSGPFSAVARYAGAPVSFSAGGNAYTLDPLSVKLDYLVTNWVYDSKETKLAVDGRFKSKSKFHDKTKTEDEGAVEIEGEGKSAAKFSWVTEATADGVLVNVIASSLQTAKDDETLDPLEVGESNYKVTWVFDTTAAVSELVWDPTLKGGLDGASGAAAASVPLFLLVVLSIFV